MVNLTFLVVDLTTAILQGRDRRRNVEDQSQYIQRSDCFLCVEHGYNTDRQKICRGCQPIYIRWKICQLLAISYQIRVGRPKNYQIATLLLRRQHSMQNWQNIPRKISPGREMLQNFWAWARYHPRKAVETSYYIISARYTRRLPVNSLQQAFRASH